jgi:DnaJ-class molecular chaperone
MPDLRSKDARGDLIATLEVQLPSELSEEETELFKKLRKLR